MTDEERAVLDAAERVREAMLAEDEAREWVRDGDGVLLTERARDQAEFDLPLAVTEWLKRKR